MKFLMICVSVLILSFALCSAGETNGLVLTEQAITNIVSQADRCAVAGDVESYSNLLAEDLVVTYAMTSEPGEPPETYNKDEYLAQLRQSLAALPIAACRTTIRKITIAADGQTADIQSISFQKSVPNAEGGVMGMTVSENATLRIRDGKIQVTKLAGSVMGMTIERALEGDK